jgi:two-component sensor histidine kinase
MAAIHFRPLPSAAVITIEQKLRSTLTDELHASLRREAAWRREYVSAMKRQGMRLHEYEHRIFNGLQMVVSTLLLQSMRAAPEMAAQLRIAAGRVAALGSVHQRLHSVDGQEKVDFKPYLLHLWERLSSLLFEGQAGHAIDVQCGNIALPAGLCGQLGLVVNELTTNSAKYAKGNITVRVETISSAKHSLSVSDDGPGLPADFDPTASKGLGMKIVLSLVKEIDGELHVLSGGNDRGARFTVTFNSSESTGILGPLALDREPCRSNKNNGVHFPHGEDKSGAAPFSSPPTD